MVSLVKGKAGWRVAGAISKVSPMGADSVRLAFFARIASLVLRLVHGEEENQYLFDTLQSAHDALLASILDPHSIELLTVARLLHALGYLPHPIADSPLFMHTAYDTEHLSEVARSDKVILSAINRTLNETHL